jgi:hypothetical protein
VIGQWFSPDTPVSSTNNTDRHDIAEILLKVALNTIILTPELKEKQSSTIRFSQKYVENYKYISVLV